MVLVFFRLSLIENNASQCENLVSENWGSPVVVEIV